MGFKLGVTIAKETFAEIGHNRVLKLSAALAYYTIFSLPGLIILIIWICDFFYGRQAIEGSIYTQISGFVGSNAALQIQETIKNASLFPEKNFSTIVGIGSLVFGATSVFGEIQDSINMIWRLKTKPKKGKGWLKLIIDRLLSFSVIITLGFLLLVSLLLNGMLDLFAHWLTTHFPVSQINLVFIFNSVLTFIITTFLFGLIFKVLPDAKIDWKTVIAGAVFTSILFMVGKYLISTLLGSNKLTTAYGAAGSVIVILLWVYYSAAILYLGAVFTRVNALHRNRAIYPSQYAVWVEQVEVETKKSLQQAVAHEAAIKQEIVPDKKEG